MNGTLLVVLIGLALVLVYLADCARWPYARCRHGCEGGRRPSRNGRRWRSCWWCRGAGKRVRGGRRVVDALRGRGWDDDL